jgi:WD40 repeat protein
VQAGGPLLAVAVRPGGRGLATAGAGGAITLWGARGERLTTLQGHTGPVKALAFSPGGEALASGGDDRVLRVWYLDESPVRRLPIHKGAITAVAFSGDGAWLASGDDRGATVVWDAPRTRAEQLLEGTAGVASLAFAPDGKTLAVGAGEGRLQLWAVATAVKGTTLVGHAGPVRCVAFSPDGKWLASLAGDGARLWRAADGDAAGTVGGPMPCGLGFAASGDLLTASPNGAVRAWSAPTWEERAWGRRVGHTGPVLALAFRPDGKVLVTGGQDGTLRWWWAETGEQLASYRCAEGPVYALAFRPDGKELASRHAQKMVVRDPKTGRRRLWTTLPVGARPGPERAALAYSPDGAVVVCADETGSTWLCLVAQRKHRSQPVPGGAHDLAFAPDGRSLLYRGAGVVGALPHKLVGAFPKAVRVGRCPGTGRLALSGDGTRLAASGSDGVVRLARLDGAGGPDLDRAGPWGALSFLAFSPDGSRLALLGEDGALRLWSADGEPQAAVRLFGPGTAANGAAFSPDGRYLATANRNGTVCVIKIPRAPEREGEGVAPGAPR